jgi:DNA-binding MarR family transcriptional regulator
MTEDVVKQLGYLTLGTRFKRIGERLQAQTQEVLEAIGIDLPSSHFPLIAALDRLGPMSVGDLTEAIGMSQPGVTRMLGKLEALDLVGSQQPTDDLRVRTVTLTPAGRRLITQAKKVAWPQVEAAVAHACKELSGSLLAQLAALEDALEKAPLKSRAGVAVGGRKRVRT